MARKVYIFTAQSKKDSIIFYESNKCDYEEKLCKFASLHISKWVLVSHILSI